MHILLCLPNPIFRLVPVLVLTRISCRPLPCPSRPTRDSPIRTRSPPTSCVTRIGCWRSPAVTPCKVTVALERASRIGTIEVDVVEASVQADGLMATPISSPHSNAFFAPTVAVGDVDQRWRWLAIVRGVNVTLDDPQLHGPLNAIVLVSRQAASEAAYDGDKRAWYDETLDRWLVRSSRARSLVLITVHLARHARRDMRRAYRGRYATRIVTEIVAPSAASAAATVHRSALARAAETSEAASVPWALRT